MTRSIVDFSDATMTLRIGDRDYTMSPFTNGDWANAQAYIRQRRLQTYLDVAGSESGLTIPTDSSNVVMARICCESVTKGQIVLDPEGSLRLIYHVLRRHDASIKWNWVLNDMPQITGGCLVAIINALSQDRPESEDPSESDPTTSP